MFFVTLPSARTCSLGIDPGTRLNLDTRAATSLWSASIVQTLGRRLVQSPSRAPSVT